MCNLRLHIVEYLPGSLLSKGFPGRLLPIGMILYWVDTAAPLAVPYKIFGLSLFLDFIDRGAINQLAASAAGSAR